jgi:hypothetical protein
MSGTDKFIKTESRLVVNRYLGILEKAANRISFCEDENFWS